MAKMVGCSKDHGKEIDLWNKPYDEKVARIRTHLEEAFKATQPSEIGEEATAKEDALNKQSYYFQQAILVFYYLIPETPEQDEEVKHLELQVRTG